MTWVMDRRGYGELRVPVRRRRERAAGWLAGELRRRRRRVLRRHWRYAVGWPLWMAACAAVPVALAGRHPRLQGVEVGVFATLALGGVWLGLMVFDGSLLQRLGRVVEEGVGDDLRRRRGVYGVVSGLRFEHLDVDHVVLTPAGVVAVEVKYLSGQPRPLADTPGVAAGVAQALQEARSLTWLLRSRGLRLSAAPLLVLTGPGAPDLGGELVEQGRVRIGAWRDSERWLPALVGQGPARLDAASARAAADVLLAYRQTRWEHERLAS